METYIPIKGYEQSYLISNFGNIKSMKKPHRNCEKLLKPMIIGSGYLMVDLGDGIKIKRHLVHRLVANNYIPNPNEKPEVNHINGIKNDNRVENLEWNTRSENQKHAIRIGLRSAKGENNSQAKLCAENVIKIFKDDRIYKHIANDYNISIITVYSIKKRKRWAHITELI